MEILNLVATNPVPLPALNQDHNPVRNLVRSQALSLDRSQVPSPAHNLVRSQALSLVHNQVLSRVLRPAETVELMSSSAKNSKVKAVSIRVTLVIMNVNLVVRFSGSLVQEEKVLTEHLA